MMTLVKVKLNVGVINVVNAKCKEVRKIQVCVQ